MTLSRIALKPTYTVDGVEAVLRSRPVETDAVKVRYVAAAAFAAWFGPLGLWLDRVVEPEAYAIAVLVAGALTAWLATRLRQERVVVLSSTAAGLTLTDRVAGLPLRKRTFGYEHLSAISLGQGPSLVVLLRDGTAVVVDAAAHHLLDLEPLVAALDAARERNHAAWRDTFAAGADASHGRLGALVQRADSDQR